MAKKLEEMKRRTNTQHTYSWTISLQAGPNRFRGMMPSQNLPCLSIIIIFLVRKRCIFWREGRDIVAHRYLCVRDWHLVRYFCCVMPVPTRETISFENVHIEPRLSEFSVGDHSSKGHLLISRKELLEIVETHPGLAPIMATFRMGHLKT